MPGKKKFPKKNTAAFGKKQFSKTLTKANLAKAMETEPTVGMRLNKYVAHCGVASRRNAAALVKEGKIMVNDKVVDEPFYQIQEEDVVKYNGEIIAPEERNVYILMNKPKNVITTTSDERGRTTVMEIIGTEVAERIFPVGRLDRDTTGYAHKMGAQRRGRQADTDRRPVVPATGGRISRVAADQTSEPLRSGHILAFPIEIIRAQRCPSAGEPIRTHPAGHRIVAPAHPGCVAHVAVGHAPPPRRQVKRWRRDMARVGVEARIGVAGKLGIGSETVGETHPPRRNRIEVVRLEEIEPVNDAAGSGLAAKGSARRRRDSRSGTFAARRTGRASHDPSHADG
jgi:ribosomal protein S4